MQQLNLAPMLPLIFLIVMIAVINWIDVLRSANKESVAYPLSLLTTLILTGWLAYRAATGETHYVFTQLAVFDPMGNVLAACSASALFVTFVYSRRYVQDRAMGTGEFYVLALFTLLGQFVMISGNNFLTLYLGLELLSLTSYTLVALRRDSGVTSEAAMKYFILGALASGFLLYGMSMLYGATGSLELAQVFKVVSQGTASGKLVLVFGIVFLVAGLAFKLGAVPFHMWVPDIYQGSPTSVTLLIAGAPKLAAFAIMFRLLVEGLQPLALDWQQMLLVLSVLSLVVGNLAAIAQTNFKRMLAYSTISHMGFLLLGLLSGVAWGGAGQSADMAASAYSASMFYAITYVLTTLGTFGLILLLAKQGNEAEELSDLKGLNQRNPWFAFLAAMMMFSLAGIPPTMGFYAKFAVLEAVVDAGMTWLAVVAVMASLIGAFYYIRVVKLIYFDAPEHHEVIEATPGFRGLLSLNGAALVVLGIFPAGLISLCYQVVRLTLAS